MLTYLLFMVPALLLGLWAQYRVQATYAAARQVPARLSGARAAREILDASGLHDVEIEMTPGHLSDHYDPTAKVLRLSPEVFQGHTAASIGIAAHEAGHALQDAERYPMLVIRNLAVPLASFGSNFAFFAIFIGAMMAWMQLILLGIFLFGLVVFFQVVNLPVEFDASSRAKHQLAVLGMANEEQLSAVRSVLNAAAWTYVAGTLSSILTLLYYVLMFTQSSSHSE